MLASPPREHRKSSTTSSAPSYRSERPRRPSVRSNSSGETRRSSGATHERERTRYSSRQNSEANLSSLREGAPDESFYDAPESPLRSPLRSPRRSSRGSRSNLVSYGAKIPETGPSYDVNIAVLGNVSVGKSTFIQRCLDLEAHEMSNPPSRVLTINGNLCAVRMYEMSLEEVYHGESKPLEWPQRIKAVMFHGVMTLYDVGNKSSFRLVPEVLNAVNKMSLPSVLAACKCDIRTDCRQLEPKTIEQRATSAFDRITTLQTSEAYNEPFRKAISAILKNVVPKSADSTSGAAGPRRQTLPAIQSGSLSPRRPPMPGHSRSTSEVPGFKRQDSYASRDQGRTPSSVASKGTSFSSSHPEDMSSSFLMDESQTDDDASLTSMSAHDTDTSDVEPEQRKETPQPPLAEEQGWTFDSLVNRLLAIPKSKADSKFAAVFLALYRKFASPGQLLESIVVRFESIEHTEPTLLTRMVSQLRYLTVVDQWIQLYPGDFAHPKTLRRIRTFIAKLRKNKIFATAAQEMENSLEHVSEDDDTQWACCDKDRKAQDVAGSNQFAYRGSLLIDDPNFDFPDEMGSLSLHAPGKDPSTSSSSQSDTTSITSSTRRAMQFEDVAQREARKLVPSPSQPLNKATWRALLDVPHDHIAKELTRMDWIMFSSIRPRDLVRHVSLSPSQKQHCKSLANVSRMIEHFNYVRDWAVNFVLLRDKPKHRALMLEKLMSVARKLRELNNYNSLGALLAGVRSTSVHRLSQTRELVNEQVKKDWMKLEILMAQTRSFSSYRLAWENSNAERIPYLPLPIRDLMGAETGNKTFIGEDGARRINWKKFEVMGDVLVGIQRAQGVPYRSSVLGGRNEDIRALVLGTRVERDDDRLYERSVSLEAVGGQGGGKGFKDFFKR